MFWATYSVKHVESGEYIEKDIFREELLELIKKMIKQDLIKDVWIYEYIYDTDDGIDFTDLIRDIEKEGVFTFSYTRHEG